MSVQRSGGFPVGWVVVGVGLAIFWGTTGYAVGVWHESGTSERALAALEQCVEVNQTALSTLRSADATLAGMTGPFDGSQALQDRVGP